MKSQILWLQTLLLPSLMLTKRKNRNYWNPFVRTAEYHWMLEKSWPNQPGRWLWQAKTNYQIHFKEWRTKSVNKRRRRILPKKPKDSVCLGWYQIPAITNETAVKASWISSWEVWGCWPDQVYVCEHAQKSKSNAEILCKV